MEYRKQNRIANRVSAISAVILITLMVGISELAGNREIIFPEIAALTVGYLCAPKQKWRVSSFRMLLLISGGAVVGLLISMFLPGSLYLKLLAAFLIAQILYLYSGTSLAPLISAIVLPVLLQSESWSYVLSAAGMTLLIVLIHAVLVKAGLRPREKFQPVPRPNRAAVIRVFWRLLIVAILAVPALHTEWRFLIAPPMLVAFTELMENWTPESPMKPYWAVLLLTACAGIGAGCRYILVTMAGLPLTLAAALAGILMLIVLYETKQFLPPAGAMTVLAMLIPESAVPLYTAEVAVGASALVSVVVLTYYVSVRVRGRAEEGEEEEPA